MQENKNNFIYGFLAAHIFAIVVSAATKFLFNDDSGSGAATLIGSEFILIPIVMGIISSYFWRDIKLSTGKRLSYAFYHLLLLCAWSWAVLMEGYICLIIVSPLVWTFVVVGIYIGYYMFRQNNNTMNFSIISLVLAIFVVDVLSKHEFINEVSDTIIIHAPAAKVWEKVAEYEPIDKKPDYWLFSIGMPDPVQSTVSAHKVGASRKCIFSNGYVFDEVMTVYEPEKNLTFDVTNQPRDPEIMGHIDILRGQFLLKDNGDGTTTLTGNSWYKLHVFPAWYYNIWAESITRNVHLRVMDHIKILCEKSSR
ncbi:MAG: hypothetical protein EOP53_06205 [Sphingobacteriales bacterium]|nr:MAG: hypothetical protein EOP53_06205 [Sphingobacteriales bacterium]